MIHRLTSRLSCWHSRDPAPWFRWPHEGLPTMEEESARYRKRIAEQQRQFEQILDRVAVQRPMHRDDPLWGC